METFAIRARNLMGVTWFDFLATIVRIFLSLSNDTTSFSDCKNRAFDTMNVVFSIVWGIAVRLMDKHKLKEPLMILLFRYIHQRQLPLVLFRHLQKRLQRTFPIPILLLLPINKSKDGAGCFSGNEYLNWLVHMGNITGIKCESHYLCESGEGKTILDAHFSYLMMHLKNVVKEGRGEMDIMNSADVVSALNANGGIASSCSHQFILNREI